MIEQGVALFDQLVVAIGINPDKRYTFPLEERLRIGASHILRGIRSESDYEYERTMRNINGDLDPAICTVFLMPPRDIAEVSSSMVKGLIGPKGWQQVVRKYVPKPVYQHIIRTHQ